MRPTYEPITEGLKLSKAQARDYTTLFHDCMKGKINDDNIAGVSSDGVNKGTFNALVKKGLILESTVDAPYTRYNYHTGLDVVVPHKVTAYALAAVDELKEAVVDYAHAQALEIVADALERERYAILADHKREEIMGRFGLAPQQITVTASCGYLYHRTAQPHTEYIIYLNVVREQRWRDQPNTIEWRDWVTVCGYYKQPEISVGSTRSDWQLAAQFGALMIVASEIVRLELYR